jgi:ABC-2 type transport system permease protein
MNPAEQWNAFVTIVIKEVRRFTRIWIQTLLPPAITMVLYFVIFGELIGRRIGRMEGFDYAQFVAPGLIMMSVITNSYSNVVSSFFGNKFSRCIEELLVSPTPNYVILAGYVVGGMARGLAVGVIVTLVSLFFTEIHIHNLPLVILTVLLTSLMFALAGLVNGVFAKNFDDVNLIPTFILTPLTYLGGIFYSISMLPEIWQGISQINPVLYMVNAFRYGFLGISDISVTFALLMIVVFIAILGAFALHLLARGKNLRA